MRGLAANSVAQCGPDARRRLLVPIALLETHEDNSATVVRVFGSTSSGGRDAVSAILSVASLRSGLVDAAMGR
jgi:hypothetical protein